MTYPQQPFAWQPPPPRKRHTLRTIGLVVLGGLMLIIIIAVATSGGSKSNDQHSTSPGVSRGIAAHDASADVKITACGSYLDGLVDGGSLAIVNHSGGRSDYSVTVTYTRADGTQVGDGIAVVQNVEAHGKAITDIAGTVSARFTACKITEVQRTASL